MKSVYNIIEIANTHGGDFSYLLRLINSFEHLQHNFGIKFQPFSASTIATEDYNWYNVYQELYFSPEQWDTIFSLVYKQKDIWLDIFDSYGVEIFNRNIEKIKGIKFQSSVLFNREVFGLLKESDLSEIKVILNIAGRPADEIRTIISDVKESLNPEEIILEFGFQSYPTSLQDCGLSKIDAIRSEFDNKLVFADHTDGTTEDSIWLPVIASLLGVEIIEKHVMLDEPTKYDHFSSLTPDRYKLMVGKITQYNEILNSDFINLKEVEYLQKTLMIPILKRDIQPFSLVSLENDFIYRRTDRNGLNVTQINSLLRSFHIVSSGKSTNDVLYKHDFKKANIATIIACRLKSSRLPKKALLPIGDLTSVEFCLSNALKFGNVSHTILATSDNDQDAELSKHTFSPSVIFHTGDADDVIDRYLSICNDLKIDVIIRVTADMPFIDDEICQFLLKKHFLSGCDYTTGKQASVGTNLEIINVQALKMVKRYFPSAKYSEYMTWYFKNNPEYFRLNIVDLPESLIRNYRLTLDYQEDLELFNHISSHFSNRDYSIKDIFKYLDENPDIAAINSSLTLRYQTDQALIDTLNSETKIRA